MYTKGSENKMNELTNFEQDLKMAYLNYENEDLEHTLKGLDRILNILLKNDTQSDPFWKEEASNVFKAVMLNNFYNKKEITINDLDSLLANQDEIKNNIAEFGNNFKNNELINFSNVINVPDNTLKSIIEIIKVNIDNIKDDKSKIDCFCGHSFSVDWSKIPETEKIVYLKCPNCGSELKRGNPNYVEKEDYPTLSDGTFVDTNNSNELEKYMVNGNDNEKIKTAKMESFNWIKECNDYDIEKVEYSYFNAGYHDEDGSSNTIEKQNNYEYDDLASIFFYCNKNNESFKLKPTFRKININNVEYIIPQIEIYHFVPNKIGLNTL